MLHIIHVITIKLCFPSYIRDFITKLLKQIYGVYFMIAV